MKIRAQVVNEFKNPEPLTDVSNVTFRFPYAGGVLEKRNGVVEDAHKGIVSCEISDFEIQGLLIGEKQNFKCEIEQKGEKLEVMFFSALNVRANGEKKEIYE